MTTSFLRHAIAAACLSGAFPATLLAQTPAVTVLPDIVVTASRTPEPLADVVGDVSVISPKQLAEARGDSVIDILARTPGIQVSTNGGPQTVSSLFLRGTNTAHALILIDGMRINGSSAGIVNFAAIDPAMLERIEILRGAASSLYGSDAIGGVINLITKKGQQDQPLSAWANVGYGTYETAKASAGISGASEKWDYSFSTSTANSKGYDATHPYLANGKRNFNHTSDKDGYRSHSVSGTLGYRWAKGHRLGLTAYDSYTHGDYDNGFSSTANVVALYRQQAYSLDSTDEILPGWRSHLKFGFTRDNYDDRGAQAVVNSLKRHYSWLNTLALGDYQEISLLLERQEERVQGTTHFEEDARNTNAAALIYKADYQRVHAQGSLRNDNISGYGNQATGSLGLDFDLSNDWQVGVAGNTAFHAPTFNDLYWPFQDFGFFGSYVGNPNLKPEKSRNFEAHFQYQNADTRLRLTAYRNVIENLISGQTDPVTQASTLMNIHHATIRGLTLSAEQTLGNTTLRASADFLDPRNDDPKPAAGFTPAEGSMLPHRARQVFHASVEHRIQALKLGAEYQYTGNRYEDAANTNRLGGYSLLNLTAAYDFNKSLGVQVRWNNVLDKDYVLVDGYNTPGSNVFVNLSWKM
ncbi:TonB-dependent receptor domain-containing protein [Castellaniella sp.]|uniref:TonB-dependent receptor domain-containing protein n=1 Tax=Castellaniella sp. TaxID=1955812 RepID=UPI003C70D101